MITLREIDEMLLQAEIMAGEIEEEFDFSLLSDRQGYLDNLIDQVDQGDVENAAERLQQILSRQGQVQQV